MRDVIAAAAIVGGLHEIVYRLLLHYIDPAAAILLSQPSLTTATVQASDVPLCRPRCYVGHPFGLLISCIDAGAATVLSQPRQATAALSRPGWTR